MTARRSLASVVTVLLTLVAATAVASPAAAAYPACNNQVVVKSKGDIISHDPPVTTTIQTQLPSASGNIDCVIGLNAHNWSVVVLQLALNACHQAGLTVDGIYGPMTRNAVLWIQGYWGLTKDGIYGPKTRNVMEWPWREPGHDAYQCDWGADEGW
ncbi:MAG: peptidoglycan-binding protein [Hamadaea sp.]|nr:peptidoglycan-binding protein [Hamadaea sp.]